MPDGSPPQAILDLVDSMRELEQRAALQYRPVVDDIVRSDSRDAQHIEHTLGGLLDFCGYGPVVVLYHAIRLRTRSPCWARGSGRTAGTAERISPGTSACARRRGCRPGGTPAVSDLAD